jgi:GH15 family glucan-1,4-alpha-glucosidase
VLETDFRTPEGAVRLTDLMPVRDDARIAPLREVLRLVEVLEGEVEIAACYAPRPDYAQRRARLRRRAGLGFACETGAGALHLLSDMPLAREGGGDEGDWLSGRERLRAGERRVFSLVFAAEEPAAFEPLDRACAIRDETVGFWRAWSDGAMHEGPFRDAVLRSAITLKLLTYAPSGALIAAATTSLPEAIGEDLNWDYRFCWLRDAALVLRAFIDLGFRNEASRFMPWLMHATRLSAPELSPVYDVFGRLDLGEETLAHLDGYRGSRPVRVGNAARRQYQLDVYGTVVLAAFDYVDRGGRLDVQARRALAGYAKVVCRS